MKYSLHTRLFGRASCLGACAIALLVAAGPAHAQQTPSQAQPGRVGIQVGKPEFERAAMPRVDIPEVRVEGAPDGADKIRFVLKTLDIEGISAYQAGAFESLYAGDIGQTISLSRIYDIAAEITRKYRNDGYIITQTVVPAQTIEGGNVKLLVVEGSIDQVYVEGKLGETAGAQIRALGNKLKNSQPLRSEDLERYLLLIGDLPGASARSIIGPSPTMAGKADLRIIVERDPYSMLLGGDNYGSAYLGPWEVTAAAQFNNLFGINDKLVTQIVSAPTDRELDYIYGSYEMPLGSEGMTVSADISYSDTEPGFDVRIFGAEGFSTTVGASLKYPFIRSRNENLTGRMRIESKSSTTTNDLGVTTEDQLRSASIGGRYELLSTFIGTSVNMADIQISRGFDIFGASDKNDPNLSRAAGDPVYTKFEAEITRLQRIVQDFNVLVGVKGQKSSTALLSPEEFGVGGMNYGYGRGYDPSEVVGDDGIAAKLEVQWNTHMFDNTIESLQLFGFYDVGTVWNKDATTSADKRNSIASAGVGIRSKITTSLSADALMAFPLTADVATERDTNPRFFVSLVNRF